MNRRFALKSLSAAITLSGAMSLPVFAQETIKIGVLHSLSGTMAISETVLKDTVLMAIDEINAKGGVLGKKLEPVVVDPASNWPLFAEKARQLITQDKVVGHLRLLDQRCRASRVLPVFEELNGLLFYPVQYEGEELGKNVFYTGAAPNQQAIPAVEYLMSKDGGGGQALGAAGHRLRVPAHHQQDPARVPHSSKGVADADIMEEYTPFGHSDYQTIIAKIKKFAAGGKKTAVVSDHQRRLQRALLQGTRQPGPEGHRRAGGGVLGRRGRAARRRHQAAGGPPRGLELLHVDQGPGQRRRSSRSGAAYAKAKKHRRPQGQAADQRPDGSHLHRHPRCGSRRSRRPRAPTPTR